MSEYKVSVKVLIESDWNLKGDPGPSHRGFGRPY